MHKIRRFIIINNHKRGRALEIIKHTSRKYDLSWIITKGEDDTITLQRRINSGL